DVAKNIREQRYRRVVVMAGAGISTPSGIPDFRYKGLSPGSGLYDNLQQYDLPYAEAIFEIGFFHRNPNPFFALAKELYPGNYLPNLTHYFVSLLHKKGQLLRMYTQNIDGLERRRCSPPCLQSGRLTGVVVFLMFGLWCLWIKWQEFLRRCWWRPMERLPRPPAPRACGNTMARISE
ncbi:NAD-dependent protein deacetylase sirtuin-3, mitochondrial, partial [Xenoophorus captivus]